ncbi:type I 3-dehydroquinate dehydratase [Enterococcus saccharolyticus]|uniref:type I 3-dehydroquinate dehydratase n=1 Tax=Enterococcus saccharolyticus TaxID=41997 RepID=UPI0039E0DCB5
MLQVRNVEIGAGRPKICVPLVGSTKKEIIEQCMKADDSAADIIEWRVDYFSEVATLEKVYDVLEVLREMTDKVLLFTFRTKEEGGERAISLTNYQELYTNIARLGQVDLMDVELSIAQFLGREFIRDLKNAAVKVVMSSHDFDKTPADGELVYRVNVMNQFGADIGKLAVMPHNLQDVLRIMGIPQKVQVFNQLPLAVMSMGDLGKVTRVSGEIIDSVFTFGSLGQASAPGQIPVEQLDIILDALHVTE